MGETTEINGKTYERGVCALVVGYTNFGCGDKFEYLLVRRSPGDKPYAGTWCLPGGKIEVGECTIAAAVRELREETGLVSVPRTLERDGTSFSSHTHLPFRYVNAERAYTDDFVLIWGDSIQELDCVPGDGHDDYSWVPFSFGREVAEAILKDGFPSTIIALDWAAKELDIKEWKHATDD